MTLMITHLIDDLSAGGVSRALAHITEASEMRAVARHDIVPVRRGRFGAPKVEADLIVSHLSVSWQNLPMFTALRAANFSTPLIHVEHSYSEGFAAERVTAHRRFRTLLGTTYALFDRVVAVSHAQAEWLDRIRVVERAALKVISPMVELSPFLALTPAIDRAPRVVGAIGRFDQQKGFDTLIRAFRAAAPEGTELHLFGNGPEEPRLRALAAGDMRIQFMGFAPEPAAAIAGLDIVAMPSRWEPYGLVCLEARAAGRPVLAARIDGLIDQIEEGAIGVSPEPDAWVETLAALPSADHGAHLALAREAALARNRQFAGEWNTLFTELTMPVQPAMQAA